MNIAIISYWTCPFTRWGELHAGGLNVYVVNLANNLGELGHRVDIYTREHKEKDEKHLKLHRNIRIIHISSVSADLNEDTGYFADKVLKFVRDNDLFYDIIHSHFYLSGLTGLILKKKLSVPLIFTFHSLGIKEFYTEDMYPKRIEAERKIVKNSDGIIVSTEYEENDLVEHYQALRKKISVVHPGVDHHIFRKYAKNHCRKKLGFPSEGKIILFVGRIDANKGINFLIKGVAQIIVKYSSSISNLQAVLIGGDIKSRSFWSHPEVKRLKKLIVENSLDCCIKFIGSRPYHILPYYYSAVDLVIMPSLYESFGLVVLEAMACGSCVLVSKTGGLKYLVEDKVNGRMFESGNKDQLCKILWELLNDERQRIKLGKEAERVSQNFCWEKQAKKTLKVYRSFS